MKLIEQYFVKRWFKRVQPIILLKDLKGKTLDVLDLYYFVDTIAVCHNGKFIYKSSNGKERREYFKSFKKS